MKYFVSDLTMNQTWAVGALLITLVQVHCFVIFQSGAQFARRREHRATVASGRLRQSALSAGSGNFLDRNFNINDDDDKNYDDDDEVDGEDEEESIEELVQRVEGEKAAATRKMKEDAVQKKKEVLKRKKDKEYDAYWRRQAKKVDGVTKDEALYNEYYTKPVSRIGRQDDEWDYSMQPKSGRENQITGVVAAGVLAGVVALKNFENAYEGSETTSATRERRGPLSSRSIHRDYTYGELKGAVKKLRSNPAEVARLPDTPAALHALPKLSVQGSLYEGPAVGMDGGGKPALQVFAFWRPSDLSSVRAARLMSRCQECYGGADSAASIQLTTVLTSRFPGEEDIGDPSGIGRSLLLNEELPGNIVIDKDGRVAAEIGVGPTPSIVMCLPMDDAGAGSGAKSKIVFVLEGERAIDTVAGNALGALLSSVSADRGAGRDLGQQLANDFPSILRPSPSVLAALPRGPTKCLKQPTRMTVDSLTGLVYLSDTGNHRVLEVELQGVSGSSSSSSSSSSSGSSSSDKVRGKVRRCFGASNGAYGAASQGTSAAEALFNRPMGVCVDPIDRFLYVADTNNDCLRKVSLGPRGEPEKSSKTTVVAVESAPPDTASDGSTYSMPELAEIERVIGRQMRSLQSLSADEAAYLLEQKGVLTKEYVESNPLAATMIGRTRRLLCPTDVSRADAFTYVSASGSHQVWRVEGNGFTLRPVFGSGLVGTRDSNEYKDYNALSGFVYAGSVGFLDDKLRFGAPAGMAAGSGRMFVVDSEASSLRAINLVEGFSSTILGGIKPGALFKSSAGNAIGSSLQAPLEGIGGSVGQGSVRNSRIVGGIGDVDAAGYKARLSLPSAITTDGRDSCLLCDTLNGKIKSVRTRGTESAVVTSLSLVDVSGGSVKLAAPQGIVTVPVTNKQNVPQTGAFLVADTGSNRVLYVNRPSEAGNGAAAVVRELELDFSVLEG